MRGRKDKRNGSFGTLLHSSSHPLRLVKRQRRLPAPVNRRSASPPATRLGGFSILSTLLTFFEACRLNRNIQTVFSMTYKDLKTYRLFLIYVSFCDNRRDPGLNVAQLYSHSTEATEGRIHPDKNPPHVFVTRRIRVGPSLKQKSRRAGPRALRYKRASSSKGSSSRSISRGIFPLPPKQWKLDHGQSSGLDTSPLSTGLRCM